MLGSKSRVISLNQWLGAEETDLEANNILSELVEHPLIFKEFLNISSLSNQDLFQDIAYFCLWLHKITFKYTQSWDKGGKKHLHCSVPGLLFLKTRTQRAFSEGPRTAQGREMSSYLTSQLDPGMTSWTQTFQKAEQVLLSSDSTEASCKHVIFKSSSLQISERTI